MSWAAYDAWATGLGDAVIEWTQPQKGLPPALTAEWPLAKFSHAFAIAIGYLLFVWIGSGIMSQLPAYKLYGLSFVYNIVQVMLCSYMTIQALILAYRNGYTFMPCNAVDLKTPPMAELLWLFYISKVLDFVDTVQIVIGKRWKQLSFLHVYHHFTIFLIYWLNLHTNYDGDIYLTIVLNGFIHSVMYTYYFVSLHTKEIWWKPFLTLCQMVQFTIMLVQGATILFKDCGRMPPRNLVTLYFYYIASLLALFANFFIQTYMGNKSKKH